MRCAQAGVPKRSSSLRPRRILGWHKSSLRSFCFACDAYGARRCAHPVRARVTWWRTILRTFAQNSTIRRARHHRRSLPLCLSLCAQHDFRRRTHLRDIEGGARLSALARWVDPEPANAEARGGHAYRDPVLSTGGRAWIESGGRRGRSFSTGGWGPCARRCSEGLRWSAVMNGLRRGEAPTKAHTFRFGVVLVQ